MGLITAPFSSMNGYPSLADLLPPQSPACILFPMFLTLHPWFRYLAGI